MANLFDVFKQNPKKMPGQGLASPDYDQIAQAREYDSLLSQYQSGLQTYGPGIAAARLNNLGTTLNGRNGTPGVAALYLQSLRDADPEAARLLDQLTHSAESDLTLDNQLDPNQRRLVEQSVRGGQAARGLGYAPSDVFQEMLMKTGYGDQLRAQRRGNALQLQQLRQATASKPVDWATQTSMNQDPEQGMWGSLLSTYGQNQENARTQAQLETKIGMDQAEKWNGWFKMAAGAAACWAAREVFGVHDPRWLAFRSWLLNVAPEKLRAWYLANGERWAERLKANPQAKAVVKRWMEKRIAR